MTSTANLPGPHRHHFHPFWRRGFYCFAIVSIVLLSGTLGLHAIEKFSYIDSFYFTCMIATGQGPAPSSSPATNLGKLFTSLLAFVSVGTMVASMGFLFGPFMGRLWKIGVIKFEEEIEHIQKKK